MSTILAVLRAIYEPAGASYPRLSLGIVAVIGALLFGGGWWLLGRDYDKRQAGTRPTPIVKLEEHMPIDAVPPTPPAQIVQAVPKGPTAQPQSPIPQPSIQQHSTGANSPNIIGNDTVINPPVNPRALIVLYDDEGNRREIRDGGAFSGLQIGGLSGIFNELWLTPVLFSGVAHANLGDIDTAITRIEDVQRRAAGDAAYAEADRLRKQIRDQTGR